MCAQKQIYPKIGLRSVMLYNFQRGLSAVACHNEMRSTIGDECPSQATIFRWFSKFKSGHLDLEDDPREGRPKTATDERNVAAVQALINEDSSVTYEMIEETLGLDAMSISRIVHDHLRLSKKSARWVPHNLSNEQKERRVAFARQFLTDFENGKSGKYNLLVTGDETWIYFYDPLLKSQSAQWSAVGAPPPTKVRRQRSAEKLWLQFSSHGAKLWRLLKLRKGAPPT